MYVSSELQTELDYYRRLHAHFEVSLKEGKKSVETLSDKVLYMLMSASFVMDTYEETFFDSFVITDKELTGKSEMQIDAYAFLETENNNEKHLHLFQYKISETNKGAASPTEVLNFATFANNFFVHPELRGTETLPILEEIDKKVHDFLNKKRGNSIKVKCHYINNVAGIFSGNQANFKPVMGRFEYDKQVWGFEIQVYGKQDILDLIEDGKIRVGVETIEIITDQPQHAYRYEDNAHKKELGLPTKVIIGFCNVNELIRLQDKYHHNQLFAENVRLYLGNRTSVNKDIIRTITTDESNWFPYMNNGISIICDSLKLGSINARKNVLPLELTNLQIINGCQTVNALYDAKYNELTRDNFKSSTLLVKIYQIEPTQQVFKQNVIRATNNQNAVKAYSLYANDSIQVDIQDVLKKLGYLYDRKGEGKAYEGNFITMLNATLAYYTIFIKKGDIVRDSARQSRAFKQEEYDKIFRIETIEDEYIGALHNLSVRLLLSALLLEKIRELNAQRATKYLEKLPIIKKSSYFLITLYYYLHEVFFNKITAKYLQFLQEETSIHKIKNIAVDEEFFRHIENSFDALVQHYQKVYDSIPAEKKMDIDNLLKSKDFSEAFQKTIEGIEPIKDI
ncbi:MAG: hypothetical protein EAZ95_14480 [Bacteroidetes bacterium]|nr:MAG: hypothetical protein EAZ95_14480 [Bacteroidota bacterium]